MEALRGGGGGEGGRRRVECKSKLHYVIVKTMCVEKNFIKTIDYCP